MPATDGEKVAAAILASARAARYGEPSQEDLVELYRHFLREIREAPDKKEES